MAMQTLTQRLANPTRFMALSARVLPWVSALAAVLIAVGLYMAFFTAPPDYQQGHTAKIMYVHVPAAWLVDVRLRAGRGLQLRPAGVPASAGRCLRQGRGADRRRVHVPLPRHRLAVGQAHVGRLLGLGPAADVGAHSFLSLSRPHRAALLHRGRAAGRQSDGDPGHRRHRHPAHHPVLRGLEQHPPAAQRLAHRHAGDPSLDPVAAAGDGRRA